MEKTIIAFKDYEYIVSMKSLFKDEFKSSSQNYLILIDHIKWFKRNVFVKKETVAVTSVRTPYPAQGTNC